MSDNVTLFSDIPAHVVEALGAVDDRGLIQRFYNDLTSRDDGAALAKAALVSTPKKGTAVSAFASSIGRLYPPEGRGRGFASVSHFLSPRYHISPSF